MKRILIGILCICLSLSPCLTVFAEESTEENLQTESETETETEAPAVIKPDDEVTTEDIILYSDSCIVMDIDTGGILYGKNIGRKEYPASITKIMTAYLACKYLDFNKEITFPREAVEGIDMFEDTNIGMTEGEKLTGTQAFYGMMMASANEVANGIGIEISGNIENFAGLMNRTAEELGCKNTHFMNPSGLHDEQHYTTAYDMALIASAAFKQPQFREVIGASYYKIEKTNLKEEPIELYPQHKMMFDGDFAYEGCLGGKTGYTDMAGSTLVTYAERDGMRLVCVAMQAHNWHHYTDTVQALDDCFKKYHKEMPSGQSSLPQSLASSYSDLVAVLDFDNSIRPRSYFIPDDFEADVPEGKTIKDLEENFVASNDLAKGIPPYSSYTYQCGTVEYTLNGQILGQGPVYVNLPRFNNNVPVTTREAVSNARLISALKAMNNSETDETKGAVDRAVSPVLNKLGEMELSPRTLAIIAAASVAIVLAVSLAFHYFKRRRRRRNYERLKKKRLEEKANEMTGETPDNK